jgi:hypothetical protein
MHCVIYRQALAVKKITNALKVVLDEVENIVKFIKSRPLERTSFSALCDEMHSATTALSFDVYRETEFRFVYSHCAQKRCYSMLTIPTSFHHVCVALCGSRG